MSSASPGKPVSSKPRFPWILLLIFCAGIYVFWILPAQMGPRHIQVQYEAGSAR
ncbi:MAG TPA: hypothetical protein VMI31_18220 [Fimbriimonadaceae bacterium]|nr:hypothetical protein [Fimbriimonadaceae bacterium]